MSKPAFLLCVLCGLLGIGIHCHADASSFDKLNKTSAYQGQSSSNRADNIVLSQLFFKNQSKNSKVSNQSVKGLPQSYQEFKARYQTAGTTPEGAVKMYFDAIFCYINPSQRSEASKMLRYAMHDRKDWDKSPFFSTFVSRLKDKEYHHIFRSFAKGTSPQNGYEMDPDNYELIFLGKRQETGYVRVSLRSTGADSPRIVQVKQFDDGLWYLINNHATYAGVRPPLDPKRNTSHDADYD